MSSPIPPIGDRFPIRYSKLWQWIGRNAMRLTGYKLVGEMPNEPKLVAVGGPHTTMWDTPMCIMTMLALGVDARIVVKQEAFSWPIFGWMLRRANCIPIDRASPRGIIEQLASKFEEDDFILAVAADGTRKDTGKIKSGFHRIARKANVPIVPITFDQKAKTMEIHPPFMATEARGRELAKVKALFDEVRARQ